LDGAGTADLTVGATLTVDALKPAADYNGTYIVIVSYQ
jgi:hypothetical protein